MFRVNHNIIISNDIFVKVGIQKLLKSDLVEPGKTETRLKLQADHRKNLKEFDKKIVTELDAKVKQYIFIHTFYPMFAISNETN